MAAVLVISFILAIGIFMLLPLGIANLFKGVITSDHLMAVLEGCDPDRDFYYLY